MKIPETIYLQWFGDYDPDLLGQSDLDGVDPDGVCWCWEQIFPHDIEYVRKESADKAIKMMQDGLNHLIQQTSDLRQELARYREREATMGWNQS
jgi:hypothetical protein